MPGKGNFSVLGVFEFRRESERELDDYTPLDGEGEFDRTGGVRRLEWGF